MKRRASCEAWVPGHVLHRRGGRDAVDDGVRGGGAILTLCEALTPSASEPLFEVRRASFETRLRVNDAACLVPFSLLPHSVVKSRLAGTRTVSPSFHAAAQTRGADCVGGRPTMTGGLRRLTAGGSTRS